MGQPEDDELEVAIKLCRAAASKMSGKRSFRLRVLLDMIQIELDKERLLRMSGQTNGHSGRPSSSR